MDFTSRLNLKKPATGDKALASDLAENFDKLDAQAAGPLVVTSISRPGAPYVGQKIWETDTKQERMWNGTAWQWVSGVVPHGKLVHDNGIQNAITTISTVPTPVGTYSTELEGGFTVSGTPGNTSSAPLHLVVPEDGRYRIDLTAFITQAIAGSVFVLAVTNANIIQYNVVRVEVAYAADFIEKGSFTARFLKNQLVRLSVWRSGGDANGGVYGAAGSYESTALEMTYEGA